MKKIILILILSLTALTGLKAQIKYLGSATLPQAILVPFKYSGYKYVALSDSIHINLYNLNWTLYKTILVPKQRTGAHINWADDVGFISEALFDRDSTNIDYVLNGRYHEESYVRIYTDKGDSLFSRDSCYLFPSYYTVKLLPGIFNTDSGTIMNLVDNSHSVTGTLRAYRLPGHLYCPPCDGKSGGPYGEAVNNVWNGWGYELNSMPNPSGNTTHITYTLPNGIAQGELLIYNLNGVEVKRFTVTNAVPYIQLSTSDLPAGTYVYKLQTTQGISKGRQQVVVH